MGKVKDRFIDYQPVREMDEMVEMASRIKGCSGLEVVYPQNFTDPVKVKALLDQHGLSVSTVNLNIKSDEIFRFGSFSSPDAKVRREAVEMLKISMDAAAVLGCNMVTTAPLSDGSDYPFELDYIRAFEDAAEAVREAANHRSDVKVSLEYKLSEPRVHCFLSDAGKAAVFCEKVGLPNVGVTLDIGHALQCGEVPADSLAFLHSVGRLFYIHINDNYRNWDWDLLPATVNLWDFIEFAFYMDRIGYDGWITADVFPQRHDPVKIMEKTFEWMDVIFELAGKLDEKKLREMRNANASLEILDYVRGIIFGK
jgi:xylose isomerase